MTDKFKNLEPMIHSSNLCNTWGTRGCFLSKHKRVSNQHGHGRSFKNRSSVNNRNYPEETQLCEELVSILSFFHNSNKIETIYVSISRGLAM